MDDNYEDHCEYRDTVFTAYSRKLLRMLLELKKHIEGNNIDYALRLLNGLIEDTKEDSKVEC